MKNQGAGWRVWVEAARPRTLPAAIAPVIAATGLAFHDGGMKPAAAAACLGFALLVQIGTNFANDYFDFLKGADTRERVGPRRAVAAGLVAPATMRRATAVVFAAAFLVGLTLLPFGGWPLVLIGVVSILCGYAYTGGPYPLAYHGLGDVFVFAFFGLVAVTATYFVQAGTVTTDAWLIGAGIGGLATNILVVNNHRDIATDRKAGKRTLAVRFGEGFSRFQFAFGHAIAIGAIVALGWRGTLAPVTAGVFAAAALLIALRHSRGLHAGATAPELIGLLGDTGRYLAVHAAALAAALAIG